MFLIIQGLIIFINNFCCGICFKKGLKKLKSSNEVIVYGDGYIILTLKL